MFPYQVVGAIGNPIDETIWADFDESVSQWRTSTGGSTNLHDQVNVDGVDTTYCRLTSPILQSTRQLAFGMESPSGEPIGSQTVELQIRAKYLEPGQTLPTAPTVTIRMDENNTQRGTSLALDLTTSFADYSFFPSTAQINSVGDWDEIEVDMSFDNTMNTGLDEEADFHVSEVRIIFSP